MDGFLQMIFFKHASFLKRRSAACPLTAGTLAAVSLPALGCNPPSRARRPEWGQPRPPRRRSRSGRCPRAVPSRPGRSPPGAAPVRGACALCGLEGAGNTALTARRDGGGGGGTGRGPRERSQDVPAPRPGRHSRRRPHVPPAPVPPPAPREAAMVLAGPGFGLAPPGRPGPGDARRGPGTGGRRARPGAAASEAAGSGRSGPAPPQEENSKLPQHGRRRSPAAAVHAGMMAAGSRRRGPSLPRPPRALPAEASAAPSRL